MEEGLCKLCSGVREEGLVGKDHFTCCGVRLWCGGRGAGEGGGACSANCKVGPQCLGRRARGGTPHRLSSAVWCWEPPLHRSPPHQLSPRPGLGWGCDGVPLPPPGPPATGPQPLLAWLLLPLLLLLLFLLLAAYFFR